MKVLQKRLFAFLISVFLVFGVVSTDYLEVKALDWVVAPTLALEEGMKFLMLLLGVSVGAETASNVDWSKMKDDCITFQENQGNSQVAVSEWWSDVLSGTLNQASKCWTSFKEWIKSLTNSDNHGLNIGGFLSNLGVNTTSIDPSYLSLIPDCAYYTYNSYQKSYSIRFFFDAIGTIYYNSGNKEDFFRVTKNNSKYYYREFNFIDGGKTLSSTNRGTSTIAGATSDTFFFFNFTSDGTSKNPFNVWDISIPNSKFNVYNPDIIPSIDLAPSDSNVADIPDVMPLPWENLGSTETEISSTIDNVIELVNEGSISIADAMTKALSMINALAIDTAAEDSLVPENPDKPDETFKDKVNENQSNMGFTLAGFEKVFPFCIPFDIYAFMTLLVAEPVAPVIEYPIYNPVSKQNEIITLDFSEWEKVVRLFRYIFDFLFIIGMLLIARALIGGGDKA